MSPTLVHPISDEPEVVPPPLPPFARRPGRPWRILSWFVGWSWRIVAGAFLCFNAYLLSYLTSILVVGWLFRWTRARVLYGWWKQSPLRWQGTFETFCAAVPGQAPV